jgi:16S rRNA (uracil1498-N3)-methyltransferase
VTLDAALRTSAAHVFVDDLDRPALAERDEHHLGRVLRLRDGEVVTVSDGRGSWRITRWRSGQVEAEGEIVTEAPEPQPTVAAAIPKGDRLEWMVQKLTEVGVDRIQLIDCARSVVRWNASRAAAQLARLDRIVREAAMQSRRVWLPELVAPVPVATVLGVEGVVVADPAGAPLESLAHLPHTVVVGPEGGFSADEIGGATLVALGTNVLRVETAALVAAVLCRQSR